MSASEPWSVVYTQYAIDFISEHVESKWVLQKILEYRTLLETVPDLGRSYDPDYPAARTPFACRELPVPDTPFTLYYLKEEEERRIVIFCVEYQRADPNARFSSIDRSLIDW
ncbi:hypothetical protein [Adlercreutzia murintestinalis]|jgi:hypothetical protein|uniref:hypothetical protein n=1 Tax=Adlercreutzia murintestinalis TaxID=2941325 RepID=UPI0020407C60|nr:hypothetical protein [Adlercreutzia murintestinalis]